MGRKRDETEKHLALEGPNERETRIKYTRASVGSDTGWYLLYGTAGTTLPCSLTLAHRTPRPHAASRLSSTNTNVERSEFIRTRSRIEEGAGSESDSTQRRGHKAFERVALLARLHLAHSQPSCTTARHGQRAQGLGQRNRVSQPISQAINPSRPPLTPAAHMNFMPQGQRQLFTHVPSHVSAQAASPRRSLGHLPRVERQNQPGGAPLVHPGPNDADPRRRLQRVPAEPLLGAP